VGEKSAELELLLEGGGAGNSLLRRLKGSGRRGEVGVEGERGRRVYDTVDPGTKNYPSHFDSTIRSCEMQEAQKVKTSFGFLFSRK
jgi:hypothetical protein